MKKNLKLNGGKQLEIDKVRRYHQIEYLAKNRENTFYAVFSPNVTEKNREKFKGNYYDFWELYIGDESLMQEAKITSVNRSRDGGTTSINYEFGEFEGVLGFSPVFEYNKEKDRLVLIRVFSTNCLRKKIRMEELLKTH